MFHKCTLAAIIALFVTSLGPVSSAEAHFGRRGGGIGGLIRARQGGSGQRSSSNPGVVVRPAPVPAPKVVATPQVVTPPSAPANKAPVAAASAKTSAPSTARLASYTSSSQKEAADSLKKEAAVPVAVIAPVNEAPPAENRPAEVEIKREVPLPRVPVGGTVTVSSQNLTNQPGQVMLQIGEIAVPVTIKEWRNDAVVCTLPILGLTKASRATLHVLKADGKTASTMSLELVTSLPTTAVPGSFESVQFDR